jgi:hypothetical protein
METNFTVSPEDQEKIEKWRRKIDRRVAKEQRAKGESFGTGAYYGAIGGELTYCFTPTGLGTIFTVKHSREDKELNLTDFDSW